MKRILFLVVLFCLLSSSAMAKLSVVSTLPWIGSVARDIGGDRIDLTILVRANLDPHAVEAKPSMILAVRKADIVMYNGLDLEIGYLPLLIESSRNPRVQPGQPGNFDCSRVVAVIEKPAAVDRSMGDVHPLGNPHYHFSPLNISRIASAMAQRFAQLDPGNSAYYSVRDEAFQKRMKEKEASWKQQPLTGKRFVAHHRLFEYLSRERGFEIIAYVEPKPGIPPSAAHLERLVTVMSQEPKPSGILTTPIYHQREADVLAQKTGVRKILLPHDVGADKGANDWFAMMDEVIRLLK
jgi:zinc/manganese transport system substrate-binding protein